MRRLPCGSVTLPSSVRFSVSVPLPVMPLTVTEYTESLTGVTATPVEATLSSWTTVKSVESTPITSSLNVTVYDTLAASTVLDGPARSIDLTVGATLSAATV